MDYKHPDYRNKFSVLSVIRIEEEDVRQPGDPHPILQTDKLLKIQYNKKVEK
jgi:hypothetical protein